MSNSSNDAPAPTSAPQSSKGILERLFKLSEKKTNVKTELIAGATTFMAMSYVIFVNPHILSLACNVPGDPASCLPYSAAFAATVWAAVIATLLMGLWANFPVAVAPGMGINAFFTFTVVQQLGLPWQTALGAVFISGIVFLILTMGGIRQAILNSVPMNLKHAIGVGIGIFIAFVGLKGAGIVVSDPATFVKAGHIASLSFGFDPASPVIPPAPVLTCAGIIFTGVLLARKVKGAMLYGVLFTTGLGMLVGAGPYPKSLAGVFSLNVPSLKATFLAMDLKAAFGYGIFSIIFTFTVVELFDNMGTLIGLTRKAGLMDKDGHIENLDRALTTDAIGTMVSATLGTSTVTSYIESAAGVAEGGRTGLTSVTVAALFLLSLFFFPLVGLVPSFATAPALIIVGALMMAEVSHIRFDDITEAIPAFLTIVMMPLTYSIANGFAFGFVSYTLLKMLSGRIKEVSWVMIVVSLAFVVNFTLRLH